MGDVIERVLSQCIVANVDGDDQKNKGLTSKYGVSGYPTIKFFSKDNKEPVDYEGGRSEADFISFLNEKCGTQRAVGGGLTDEVSLELQLYIIPSYTLFPYLHLSRSLGSIVSLASACLIDLFYRYQVINHALTGWPSCRPRCAGKQVLRRDWRGAGFNLQGGSDPSS